MPLRMYSPAIEVRRSVQLRVRETSDPVDRTAFLNDHGLKITNPERNFLKVNELTAN